MPETHGHPKSRPRTGHAAEAFQQRAPPDCGLSAHQAGSLQTGLCTRGPRDTSRWPPSPHGRADPGSATAGVLGFRHEVHIWASDTWGWLTGGCPALGCRGKSPDGRTCSGHPRGPTARAGRQDGGSEDSQTPFQNQAPHLAEQAKMCTRDPGGARVWRTRRRPGCQTRWPQG